MTDISVIKMIISVAVWRIYPSWVNDKLRAWEGFGHSRKFWARLSRDDFRSKLEIIPFLSRDMTFSKSFLVSRAFEKFGAKPSSSGAFGFDDVLEVFLKTPLRHRAFFCELRLRPRVIFETFLSFFQRAGVTFPDSYGDPQAEQSTLVMIRQKLEWKLDRPPALVRSSAEGPSIVVAIGTSRVRWSIVQKEKKNTTKPASDRAKSQPFIIFKPGSFEQPVFETRCHNRFALRCYRARECTAVGRTGCSAGKAKKSSHPWHFRC